MSNPIAAYEKSSIDSKVMGETPHGLVRLLLEKLCERLSLAHELLTEKDTHLNRVETAIKVATALSTSTDIVQALSDSLVKTEDSELFEELSYLYAHIQYQILMANMNQKPEPVAQSLKIAASLLETWVGIPAEFHHMTSRE